MKGSTRILARTVWIGLAVLCGQKRSQSHAFVPATKSFKGHAIATISTPRLPLEAPQHVSRRKVSVLPHPPTDPFLPDKNMVPTRSPRRNRSSVTVIYLSMWYIFSVGYNIWSKRALTVAPDFAWFTALWQMSVGFGFWVVPQWVSGHRPFSFPRSLSARRHLFLVSLLHTMVHVGGVVSMGAGPVAVTYLVKASEPVISAGLHVMTGHTWIPASTMSTLIPIVVGVAMATSGTSGAPAAAAGVVVPPSAWMAKSIGYAMLSNVASAARGILGKRGLAETEGGSVSSPRDLYALVSLISSFILLPLVLAMQGGTTQLFKSWTTLSITDRRNFVLWNTWASFLYYWYNELSFVCLGRLSSPVSHAIANTMKRVVIIVASWIVFGNVGGPRAWLGSTLALSGVLAYSLLQEQQKRGQANAGRGVQPKTQP